MNARHASVAIVGTPPCSDRHSPRRDCPAVRLLAGMQEQKIKDRLAANTQEAHARGAFGIPTFLVGGELYFCKDKLRDVELALMSGLREGSKQSFFGKKNQKTFATGHSTWVGWRTY